MYGRFTLRLREIVPGGQKILPAMRIKMDTGIAVTRVMTMRHGRFLVTTGVLFAGWACCAVADYGQLLERLRIDHAAMVAAEADFHERRQRGSLSGTEAADYAAYVARLHRQVAEDCVALAGGAGLPLPAELGCPTLPPRLPAPAAIDQMAEQTVDEQIAALDAELFSGLGEFDEMLLREQERVRAAAPMSDAAAGGGGDDGGDAGDAGGYEGAAGGEAADGEFGAGSDAEGDSSTSYGGGAGRGTRRQGGGQGVPPDIPDGSDDDVVARQLREAAEKETDPELKKKLWEEYRKYKKGTR